MNNYYCEEDDCNWSSYNDDERNNEDFYEEGETWGQENEACDRFDNCFECPFADECF